MSGFHEGVLVWRIVTVSSCAMHWAENICCRRFTYVGRSITKSYSVQEYRTGTCKE